MVARGCSRPIARKRAPIPVSNLMEEEMFTSKPAFLALVIVGASALVGGAATRSDAASVLTAKDGMTVYVFDKDAKGVPSCYGDCAKKWPPYVAKKDQAMGKGWSEVKRTDGSMQWVYDGHPLYFYSADKKKGDKKGDGIGGVWHVVSES